MCMEKILHLQPCQEASLTLQEQPSPWGECLHMGYSIQRMRRGLTSTRVEKLSLQRHLPQLEAPPEEGGREPSRNRSWLPSNPKAGLEGAGRNPWSSAFSHRGALLS